MGGSLHACRGGLLAWAHFPRERASACSLFRLHGHDPHENLQSRLAVNSVTLGNYEEPLRISVFVKDLFAGFAMVSH